MLVDEKRLYISPFTRETLPTILRAPLSSLAHTVSFHTILTFPEKPYGFVTLPAVEADKLKQKINGAVLRGTKMQVKDARPRRPSAGAREKDGEDKAIQKGRKTKKSKDISTVAGVELEPGRKVTRGWTSDGNRQKQDTKGKRKTPRAESITGKEECLFKTRVPPNKEDTTTAAEMEGKVAKRKRGQSSVVHEFTNTEKYSTFLRERPSENANGLATEFVDGKGWIDKDGNTVEAGPAKRSKRSAVVPETPRVDSAVKDDDETSSSGTDEEESEDSEAPEKTTTLNAKGLGINQNVERLSITRSSATPPPDAKKSPEIHPLESLFKRPAKAASQTPKEKPLLEVSTTFSFSDPDGQEVETRLNIPQTPFTQQDIRQRRERSAAPTPDTAAPGKTFGNVWGTLDSSDIASESEEDEALAQGAEKPKEGEQSDFAAWFYEHRGENNRAWKQRRREAAKEKRQSDNRKRRDG